MATLPAQSNRTARLSTEVVHAGENRPYPHHALTLPIFDTATYTFENTADLRQFMEARMWGLAEGRVEYGRYGNPTVSAVEARVAALAGGQASVLMSSGMAAVTSTLLSLLYAGDHLVITDDSYRRTRQFCTTFLKRWGIECSVVPAGDLDQLEAAIRPDTKVIVSESPTNPYLRVMDLERLVAIAKRHKVKTLIDSTFATPINQRPLEFGVDLVVDSATKYLGGHNDLLAGAVVGSESLMAMIRQNQWVLGAVCDPHTAYLIQRGLKTLALRVHQQNTSAMKVAEFLESHARVLRVWYPGLRSHPDYDIAREQMRGFGGVVSFELDGDLDTTSQFIDAVQIPLIASSLGGVETLIEQPALMSYFELSTDERLEIGIKDNLVRLSVGIESPDDLIADLAEALRLP
ncbi:MAG: PLP-dependent aspartate aminotransferase family protein [Anaerolineales bacterium]